MRTVDHQAENGGNDRVADSLSGVGFNRAAEVDDLITAVKSLVVPFIARADSEQSLSNGGGQGAASTLVDSQSPQELVKLLQFELPEDGRGRDGLLAVVDRVLRYSVNTWDRGYMDKLTGSTNAAGVAAELVLAVLNTNLHVYKVSPVLTTIEKLTARALAGLFGLTGPHAGGFTTPGGSAANTTALVVARNERFPDTKAHGHGGRRFVVFAGAHGHYSVDKAAQVCGIGAANVWAVPVDARCRMIASELERLVRKARDEGLTPFFVSASAGTTVMGAFDPFPEIAAVCRREGLWFHIDAVYGGAVVFSARHGHKMLGAELADSVALNPHKMMGVPTTCSFLLGADLRAFWRSNTLPAGYLFHDAQQAAGAAPGLAGAAEHWDLADLTLQCGRRGDALKLALGWTFYGRSGYGAQIDGAYEVSAYLASLVAAHGDLELISENPPPCLQVCFYYAPGGAADSRAKEENTRVTEEISRRLVGRGFMVNFSPGERGSFINAAVHFETTRVTVQALVRAVVEIGNSLESEGGRGSGC